MSLQCSVQEVPTYIYSKGHVVTFSRSPNWHKHLFVVGEVRWGVVLWMFHWYYFCS